MSRNPAHAPGPCLPPMMSKMPYKGLSAFGAIPFSSTKGAILCFVGSLAVYLVSIHPLEHRSTSPWLQKYLQTSTDVPRGWGRELPLIGEPQAWSHPGLGDSPPFWVSLALEPEPTDTAPQSGLSIRCHNLPTHTSCSTQIMFITGFCV